MKWLLIIFVFFVVVAPAAIAVNPIEQIISSIDDVRQAIRIIQSDVDILKDMHTLLKEIRYNDKDVVKLLSDNRQLLTKLDMVIDVLKNTMTGCSSKLKCYNGGTCMKLGSVEKCYCPPGYIGSVCQTKEFQTPAGCQRKTCHNGGKCYVENGIELCKCPEAYGGVDCKDQIKCIKRVCQNGGTCYVVFGNEMCTCARDYFGDECKVRKVFCRRLNCKNGGTCNVVEGKEFCACKTGFFGDDCGISIEACQRLNCKNGGTCHKLQEGDRKIEICRCMKGFTGTDCSTSLTMTPTSKPGSCVGRCDQGKDDGGCYCDKICKDHGDCCKDYDQTCGKSVRGRRKRSSLFSYGDIPNGS